MLRILVVLFLIFNFALAQEFSWAPLDESSDGTSCSSTPSKFDNAAKDLIVKLHNKLREQTGSKFMMKMQWSEQLAGRAQYFSDQCPNDHGGNTLCNGEKTGQNMIVKKALNGHADINITRGVYESWGNDEKKHFHLGNNGCDSGHLCGHYTQAVWETSFQVGCGISKCKKEGDEWPYRTVFVCNYYPRGNQNDFKPFSPGDPCTGCADGLYPAPYKCVDSTFCKPCREGEEGCISQNSCRDLDPDQNCAMIAPMFCEDKDSLKANDMLYEAMNTNCKKSCGLC